VENKNGRWRIGKAAWRVMVVAWRIGKAACRVIFVACRIGKDACRMGKVMCRIGKPACRIGEVACRIPGNGCGARQRLGNEGNKVLKIRNGALKSFEMVSRRTRGPRRNGLCIICVFSDFCGLLLSFALEIVRF
jgi:hypothetical protein